MDLRKFPSIDMHAHWVPDRLADVLRGRARPPMIRDHKYHTGQLAVTLEKGFDQTPLRIAEMDRNAVEHAVLSFAPGFSITTLPVEDSLPLCRLYNQAVSDLSTAYPGRISAFASLPTRDPALALAEFEAAMEMPGIIGALLPGDGFLSEKDAEPFRPLLEAADRRGALLFIHSGAISPETAMAPPTDNAYVRITTLDFQGRLSQNMVTFCFTDLLEPYKNLTIVSHNLGGNFPFEVGRIDYRHACEKPDDEPPSHHIRRTKFLLDCNSLPPEALALGLACYGPNRLMFGSDGTELGMKTTRESIARTPCDEAEKRAILYTTASRALARVNKTAKAA